jgi:hypothetical protein
MKTISLIALSLFLVVALAVPAFAVEDIQTTNLLTNKAASGDSSVVDTGLRTQKTVFIAGTHSAGVYGTYSGVVTLKCAPTASGPWVTCKDRANTATTVSHVDGYFHLNDLIRYIKVTYAQTKNNVSVWLYSAK